MVQKQIDKLKNHKHFDFVKTFIKFGAVGLVGTCIDFLVLAFTVQILHFNPVLGKVFANESAIINNFLLNSRFTFNKREAKLNQWQRFISYNSTYIGSLLISVALIAILVHYFGQHYYLLYNVFTVPINIIWNFAWSHLFTWKEHSNVSAN